MEGMRRKGYKSQVTSCEESQRLLQFSCMAHYPAVVLVRSSVSFWNTYRRN